MQTSPRNFSKTGNFGKREHVLGTLKQRARLRRNAEVKNVLEAIAKIIRVDSESMAPGEVFELVNDKMKEAGILSVDDLAQLFHEYGIDIGSGMMKLKPNPIEKETDDTSKAAYNMSVGRRLPVVHEETRTQVLDMMEPSLDIRAATEEDIPAMTEVYNKVYYPREAFQIVANRALVHQLRNHEDPQERKRLYDALDALSSSGEFEHIFPEEWKERIDHPGERVLLIQHEGRLVAVSSYCLGPAAQGKIAERFNQIDLDDNGRAWLNHMERLDPMNPNKYMALINDIYIDPEFQSKGLFQRIVEMMTDYELHRPDEDRIIREEERENWVYYWFVNRFEQIFAEGDENQEDLHIADRISTNNVTLIAGMKFGASPIGLTRAKRMKGAVPVPKIEGDLNDVIRDEQGRIIFVMRGYQDMIHPFSTIKRKREKREASQ